MGPAPSDPQDLAPKREEAFASPVAERAQGTLASAAPPADRPETAPQEPEKAQSAPENGMAAVSAELQDAPPIRGETFAPRRAARAWDPFEPLMTGRNDIAPQPLETREFAGPALGNLGGLRRPNVRATLNGVMAC